MKKKALLALLAVALLAAVVGWMKQRSAPAPTVPAAANAPAPVEFAPTDLITLAPGPLSRAIPITGTLRPLNQTVVKAKVAGEVRELLVREGETVRKGQLLGRIDLAEYQVRVTERQAQVAAAESQVAQARRTLDNSLALQAKNFISQSALDSARSGWEVAVGNRDAAAAQLALARKALTDAALLAPIDGIVAERFAQPGEKLPVDGRVLSIVDLSRMEIEALIPASDIGRVQGGQAVELSIEGVTARQVGRISRIAPGTQTGTRSVPVYIALDNRDPSVRAGLFAQGRLTVDTRMGVISVPAAAIRDAGARTFVYLITNEQLVEREVKTGLRDDSHPGGDRIEIVSGLSAGDRIVGSNLGRLRSGSPVRVVTVPTPATR